MRLRHKVDLTQSAIVEALRRAGCTVRDTSMVGQGFPDLTVGRSGLNYLIECKSARGTLTPDEREFIATWRGDVHICYTPEDALLAVGAVAPQK